MTQHGNASANFAHFGHCPDRRGIVIEGLAFGKHVQQHVRIE